MVEKQANEPTVANEAQDFDSTDPFEVLRHADRFEDAERESERQYNTGEEELLEKVGASVTKVETPSQPVVTQTADEAPKAYKFAGKEYSGEDLVREYSDPEKILGLLTAREQYANLNRKHQEMMEEYKAAKLKGEVVDAVRQVIPSQQHPTDPREIVAGARKTLQPVVDTWIANGIIDQDTADAIPDVISVLAYQQAEYMRKAAEIDRIYAEEIRPILDYGKQLKQTGTQQGIVNALDSTINRVTGRGGVFGSLANNDTKAQFVQYIAELNPEVDVLFSEKADDFIAKQFIAFNSDQLMQMYQQANQTAQPRTREISRASGTGSSPRQGRTEESNVDIKRVLFAKG